MTTKNPQLSENEKAEECEFCGNESVAICARCDVPMCENCIGGNSAYGIVCWDCEDDLNDW